MKIIALSSGGIDSTVLVYKLIAEDHFVKTLSFNYGQRHQKENDIAYKLMTTIALGHKVIDISDIAQLIKSSALINKNQSLSSSQTTIVPNRNAIFLAIATAYALDRGFDAVAFGVH